MLFTEYEENVIKKEYPLGGCKAVQKLINRPNDSIRYKAKALGITRIDGFRLSNINFDEIIKGKSPETCYILGLLWGDGTLAINKKRRTYLTALTLAEKDFFEISHFFSKFHIHKIKKYKTSWKQCFRAYIGHKLLATYLEEKDFLIKSYVSPEKILQDIPENNQHYFFRGWFDADGYNNGLPKNKISIVMAGSYSQKWTAFEDLLNKLNIPFKVSRVINKRGNKYSIISFGGYNRVLRFRDYLYQGEQFGLSRKRNNFFNIKVPLWTYGK